jgi:hypothetical protein
MSMPSRSEAANMSGSANWGNNSRDALSRPPQPPMTAAQRSQVRLKWKHFQIITTKVRAIVGDIKMDNLANWCSRISQIYLI